VPDRKDTCTPASTEAQLVGDPLWQNERARRARMASVTEARPGSRRRSAPALRTDWRRVSWLTAC